MFFSKASAGQIYVPRDNASGYDFITTDFVKDGGWRVLDLSEIIPAGARAVHCRIGYGSTATGNSFYIKPFSDSTGFGALVFQTIVANIIMHQSAVCGCISQQVYYKVDSATWPWIDFVILGWWELV